MSERKLVRDLMSVGVPTCALETPLPQIARLLLNSDIDCVVVLDTEGHAPGVVSQDDLVKAYIQENWDSLVAEDIMQENVPQVPPDIPLTVAAQIMRDQHVRSVFMMHHAGGVSYSAAALSYKHLMRHMAAQNDDELKDLGTQASRKGPLEAFIERRDAARRKNLPHSEET
jgi:CBS domain-containing protein